MCYQLPFIHSFELNSLPRLFSRPCLSYVRLAYYFHRQEWDSYSVPGSTTKNLWTDHPFIRAMLNTDIALAFDAGTDNGSGAIPVAPLPTPLPTNANVPRTGANQRCGPQTFDDGNDLNCPLRGGNKRSTLLNVTLPLVQQYANNNTFFLERFAVSFTKMVNAGYSSSATGSVVGKLGTLTPMLC